MIDVEAIRKQFNIYKDNKNLTYLDSAASALKVERAVNAVSDYYNKYGVNVHRGAYNLTHIATDHYEKARVTTSEFINAKLDEIIFTKGATQALNIVANGYLDILGPDDEIIVSELEHHSSVIPWINVSKRTGAKLNYVPLTKEGKITVDNFEKVITSKTKIVALTLASNVMGYVTPMKEIIKVIRSESSAKVVVDAAQAAPHMKIDVKELDCDFLAFSGHKIYGPSGVGVLYGKEGNLNDINPFEFGGEMALEVDKQDVEFKSAPLKFEAGTPVIAGAIGLAAAIEFINEVTFKEISSHIDELHQYTLNKLSDLDGVNIYNKTAELGIITFNIDDVHPHDIASYLDQKDVACRAGHHCAQLVSKFLGVPSTVRVSFNIYNDIEDCDKFVDAVIGARDFFRQF